MSEREKEEVYESLIKYPHVKLSPSSIQFSSATLLPISISLNISSLHSEQEFLTWGLGSGINSVSAEWEEHERPPS